MKSRDSPCPYLPYIPQEGMAPSLYPVTSSRGEHPAQSTGSCQSSVCPEFLSPWLQKFLLSAFLMVGNRNHSGCFKKKMYLLMTFGSLSSLKIIESWGRSFQEKCPNIAELVWRWDHHGSYRELKARDPSSQLHGLLSLVVLSLPCLGLDLVSQGLKPLLLLSLAKAFPWQSLVSRVAHVLISRTKSYMDVYDDRAGSQACISVTKEAGS